MIGLRNRHSNAAGKELQMKIKTGTVGVCGSAETHVPPTGCLGAMVCFDESKRTPAVPKQPVGLNIAETATVDPEWLASSL
jgi:hypothetical protein